MNHKTISLILPFYNEETNLPILFDRLQVITSTLDYTFEYLFVNDGSSDGSSAFIRQLVRQYPFVRLIEFSRNFGQQAAVQAGLQQSRGDAVIIMDTDLQDRPESIADFITHWEAGYEVVYAIRQKRKENFIKRFLFNLFYRVMAAMSEISIPREAGLFSLMDRQVVDLIATLPERNRYIPGLRAWAGFRQTGIPVERDPRGDVTPRVSTLQLFKLAVDAIFSFSRIPLRLATFLGIFSALLAVAGTGVVLYKKFISLQAITGWTSTLLSIFFFGAVQLITIGIIGEYLGRIYEEVKRRPLYVIHRQFPAASPSDGDDFLSQESPAPEDTPIPPERPEAPQA